MEFSVGQIAALVNGRVEGDPEARIDTFAKIEEGHPGAISFLANEKYTHYIYTTASTAVLVRRISWPNIQSTPPSSESMIPTLR